MGIDLDDAPQEQLDRIPKKRTRCLRANHPHYGMVDGMIFADLIGSSRPDYRHPSPRFFVNSIDEVRGSYMIPVAVCSRFLMHSARASKMRAKADAAT